MKRFIFENIFETEEFLNRKQQLFDFLRSIGMDSNASESYTDINKDGLDDTLMTHFNMGDVTVYVGLCNFSSGEFQYLLYVKSSEGIVLKPNFFNSISEIEKQVAPYIESAYEDTKLSYLGIEKKNDYIPSKSEYNDMINSAIDNEDWEEVQRIQKQYGYLYESKKIIRLKESDLSRIIKKIILESKKNNEDEILYLKDEMDEVVKYYIKMVKTDMKTENKKTISKYDALDYLDDFYEDLDEILSSSEDMDDYVYFELDDHSVECKTSFKNFLKDVTSTRDDNDTSYRMRIPF